MGTVGTVVGSEGLSPGDDSPVIEAWVEEVVRRHGGCLVVEGFELPDVAVPEAVEVIRFRARADERFLIYAGLAEVTAPLLPLLSRLPPVQAAALEGALALGPPAGDSLAVATAVSTLLHLSAERAPLIVAIEQAHLLDPGTAAVVAHATRRLADTAVGILVTQDPHSPDRLDLPDAARITGAGTSPRGRTADGPAARAVAGRRPAPDPGVSGDARSDVLLRTAAAWLDAGHAERAVGAAEDALASASRPELAGRAHLLLGRARASLGSGRESRAHLEEAARVAGSCAPRVAAEAHLLLAIPALFSGRQGDAQGSLRAGSALLVAAGVPDDDPLRRFHVVATLALDLASGRSTDVEPIAELVEGLAVEGALVGDLALVVTTVALPLIWIERYDTAASFLRGVISTLRARGAIGALPMPLCALAVAERRAGRPTRSLVLAAEAADLAAESGDRTARLFAESELANAHALFGDVERCRRAAEEVLASGTRGAFRTSALSALATAELWSGDPKVAIELLEPLATAPGALVPAVTLFHHTLITSYFSVGRIDDARALLDELSTAAAPSDGRLEGVVARCAALLAPAEERDERFADAIEQMRDSPVNHGLSRLLYARRLLADGCTARAAVLLDELSREADENLLGVARSARLILTRLGLAVATGDPAWSQLGPAELEVALAAAEHTPVLALADRLRISPPEVERLRDDVLTVIGARGGSAVGDALARPVTQGDPARPPHLEVRVLGGLAVLVDGGPVPLPVGAASTAVAMLALRRAVHVEELTEVLWPEATPEVARRRLRNVLARVKQAVGPVLVRRGDRVELGADVVVDHHVLDARARRALSAPPGPQRSASIQAVLDAERGPLLPEMLYEQWSDPERARAELRRDELVCALADDRSI